ncbi:MAG TPA: hypothetical protein VFP80_03790, partial [Thermoanaerobaculia bacterium]|nr:hypothetical protein [Thermoanaerobaculia bacterium]
DDLATALLDMKREIVPVAVLTGILTVLFVDVLAGVNALYLRDLAHYYYPAKHVLREIVLGGEFPYWNPLLAAGQPMAANPEHEVFYPLTWLVLLPSYDLGFRLLVLLHIHITAWTMYALLRSMRASPAAAFLGALSFALGGVVLSSLTLLPILFVLAWLPLTCLFTRRFLLHRRPRDFVFAALSLGLQMLIGEPTTIAQTGFLLGAYAIALGIRERTIRPLAYVALISIVALAVGAAAVLPAIDHAGDSVRSRGFEFDVVTTWSTPFARIADLFWPNATPPRLYERGTPFYLSIYPGLLATLLVIAGFALRMRGAALTGAILAVSWLLALGDHTPLWGWLYDLGLARSVRYPEKFLLLGAFAMAVFGARVLDRVLSSGTTWKVALATVFVLLDLGRTLPDVAPRMPASYLTEPPLLARQLPAERDSWRLLHVIELQNSDPAFRPFTTGPDLYWIRRNALRPMMPARWGIRTVLELDYDQTALLPATDFAEVAFWLAHGRPDWPALLAPMANARFLGSYDDPQRALARVNGDRKTVQPVRIVPLGDNPRYFFAERVEPIRDVRDFAGKLATARSTRGVAYVSVLPASRGQRAERRGQKPDDPRPLLRSALRALPSGSRRSAVLDVRETANTARIEADTSGPAFLVISVTPHKYWTIAVDGRAATAVVTNVGFQGVVIPGPGHHVVEMRYRNPLIPIGAAISAAALLALAFVAITMRGL